MMYQNITVPIDHGNRNVKTESRIFTSGYEVSDCKPALGEYLYYQGHYYTLSCQRIPYMRDKTVDERFFILSLFAIALEVRDRIITADTILRVDLPIGLPPKHYGSLYQKFEEYFQNRGVQTFYDEGRELKVEINEVVAFPQDYAAAMTQYKEIKDYAKVITVDIGGVTLDYMLIRNGQPDVSVCDSLEKGVIPLYNKVISRIRNEYDTLLEEIDVDSIIQNKKTDFQEEIINIVKSEVKIYVDDILGTLRESGLDLKTGCVVFIGGGAKLLRTYLEESDRIGQRIFIQDICANAKGYGLLYQIQKRKGR